MTKFAQVMEDELALIQSQLGKEQGGKKTRDNLTGLAFSGGGIRSATFNLGVIQSLAGKRHLQKFDYLSTVSGGGYIGSWLSAQIRRHKRDENERSGLQKVAEFEEDLNNAEKLGIEHGAIKWLRSFSNYLTPKKGLSGDFLAAVGSWLRNTILNQATLFMFFATLLLLPHLITFLSSLEAGWITPRLQWLLLSIVLACGAILLCTLQLPKLRCCNNPNCQSSIKQKNIWLTWLIIPMAVLSAYCLSMWMYWTSGYLHIWEAAAVQGSNSGWALFQQVLCELPLIAEGEQVSSPMLTMIEANWSPLFISALWALIYALPWVFAMIYTLVMPRFRPCKSMDQTATGEAAAIKGEAPQAAQLAQSAEQAAASPVRFAFSAVLSALLSGLFGGWLIYLLSYVVAQQNENVRLWWATGYGTPLILMIFCLILVLHQGLMARLFRVSQLEWWARLGGYVLLLSVVWAGMHTLLLYVPPLINMLQSYIVAAGGAVWVVHTLAGIVLGKSAATSGSKSVAWKELVSRAAPYMFVLGYLVATSWVVHALVYKFGTAETPYHLHYQLPEGHEVVAFENYLLHALDINNHASLAALIIMLVSGFLAFLLLAWRLDVNLFSIHHFYRNRLTRCYLGAGRGAKRVPDQFTGFDPCDDIRIAGLKQRPLHLVNTALNLVNGGELAWQDRKAYSFTFSPVACGFEYPQNAARPGGEYCDTAKYMDGVNLGTAMATSGAAASPNMGYHSSPAVAFLLTVFNVRLGHWCPNPQAKTWLGDPVKRKSPLLGGIYLLKELFGMTDDRSNFVYLSDGGHFENLAVYELVRRRCRYIMVVDAGQDEKRTFEDVGNLVRKCAIDFGVKIDINLDDLRADAGISKECFALGDIAYPPLAKEGEATKGVLLYLKPSLLGDIPEDILQYSKNNTSFPHQPTADQFFDEAQFESYRHLGKFLMDRVIHNVGEQTTPGGQLWSWE